MYTKCFRVFFLNKNTIFLLVKIYSYLQISKITEHNAN